MQEISTSTNNQKRPVPLTSWLTQERSKSKMTENNDSVLYNHEYMFGQLPVQLVSQSSVKSKCLQA